MEEKRGVKLSPAGLHFAEHQRNTWVVTAERGVTKADLLDPGYWSHVSQKLRPYDHIEVRAEDGTFYATYLVLSCDRTWAKVFNLTFSSLTTADISQTQAAQILDDYEVKFRGAAKWGVIRRDDRALLVDKLHTREDAENWLKLHLNSLSVPA